MTWGELLRSGLRAPGETVQHLLDMNLPARVHWQALALTTLMSVILATLSLMLFPVDLPPLFAFLAEPLKNLMLQGVFTVIFVIAYSSFLRVFSGHCTSSQIALIVAVVQLVMLALLVLQILLPFLAGLIALAGFVLYPWLLARFAAAAAGHAQPFGAFLLIFPALFAAGLATTLIMLFLGIISVEDMNNA